MLRKRPVRLLLVVLIVSLFPSLGQPAPAQAAPPAVPIALVTLDMPGDVMVGENFTFQVTFDNADVVDTGYGPFIDLVLPLNGADGAAGSATPDGIDFVDADYLGQPLDVVEQVFPAGGCVDHPLARDLQNVPYPVCGTPGDKLVTIRVPFGSFTPGQPAITIDVTASMSVLADLGVPLTIRARGGFQFGANSMNDPCCDPVILTPGDANSNLWPGSPVLPVVIRLDKTSAAPENGSEIATGPSFASTYTITIDIANGQAISNLDVTDLLPPQMAYDGTVVGVTTLNPPGATYTETLPPANVANNPPNNALVIAFTQPVIGTAAANDIEIVWGFFIPEFLPDGSTPVLNPTTGDDLLVSNEAEGVGDWVPADPRDLAAAGNAIAPGGAAPEHSLWARSMAAQKSVSIVTDTPPTGFSPGDTLRFTLPFQVSDYFTAGDLVITDILPDGLTYVTDSAELYVYDRSTSFGVPFPAADLAITTLGNDDTRLAFDISGAMLTIGEADGVLQGGRATGTVEAAAYGEIVFRATINESYASPDGGNANLDQGDLLTNATLLDGSLRDNLAVGTPIGTEDDPSSVEIEIVHIGAEKTIYAVNGTTCGACLNVELEPGDTVTFRLRATLPTSDFENLRFDDYLVLPTFDATELTTLADTASAVPPPAGTAYFGPTDTFRSTFGLLPVMTVNAGANTVIFTYGSHSDLANTSTAIDLLYTVTVTNIPFADQLILTNFVRAYEQITTQEINTYDDAVSFRVRYPYLIIRKSVVGSSNPASVLNPPLSSSITFAPPGTAGTPWTGTLSSTDLGAGPIDSDMDGGESGDRVRFAIVIENVGTGSDGAFDIVVRDNLPVGFAIPADMNLQAVRGDGTPVTVIGAPQDLFGPGIELVDGGPGIGVCASYDPASGQNIVVITYDLLIDTTGPVSGEIQNLGQVSQYSHADSLGSSANYVADQQTAADSAILRGLRFDFTIDDSDGGTGGDSSAASGDLGDVTTLPATGYPPDEE
ncbi:MAG: DUF11 domain-containing protein [Chloroflexi bacterium]|nr:DUF11 domain-containing protein [Chloroflexota bacterium]